MLAGLQSVTPLTAVSGLRPNRWWGAQGGAANNNRMMMIGWVRRLTSSISQPPPSNVHFAGRGLRGPGDENHLHPPQCAARGELGCQDAEFGCVSASTTFLAQTRCQDLPNVVIALLSLS